MKNLSDQFAEVAAKAEENGALLTISVVLPNKIHEDMPYQIKKLTDSTDPIDMLDAIDKYIGTDEFNIRLFKAKNTVDEIEAARKLNEELSNIKVEISAFDIVRIANSGNAIQTFVKDLLFASVGNEAYDGIAEKLAAEHRFKESHRILEELLTKTYNWETDESTPETTTD